MKKLLVGGVIVEINSVRTRSFEVLSYPSSMSVSSRSLNMLAEALRQERHARRTRWRRLDAGEQALLVLA